MGELGWLYLSKETTIFLKMGYFSREWILSVGEDLFFSSVFIITENCLLVILIANGPLLGRIFNICIVLICNFLLIGTASFA